MKLKRIDLGVSQTVFYHVSATVSAFGITYYIRYRKSKKEIVKMYKDYLIYNYEPTSYESDYINWFTGSREKNVHR